MVLLQNRDQPGVIGTVGSSFGDAGVNIADMPANAIVVPGVNSKPESWSDSDLGPNCPTGKADQRKSRRTAGSAARLRKVCRVAPHCALPHIRAVSMSGL